MGRMLKRAKTNPVKEFLDVYERQVGELSPRKFAHRVGGSENFVLRLDLYKKLEKHRGCVNTVSFNAEGDILVSGSDDRLVVLWDWDAGNVKLSFHSGHTNNVFQAKIIPYTGNRSIVTCAADGQVRHAQIPECGRVEMVTLGKHQGRAHKLAIEPGNPHVFYTCGEDGVVQHFDLRTGASTELFTCKSFDDKSRYVPVVHLNAIAIDPRNPNFFAIAGSDEYARLYDIRKYRWDGSTNFGQPTDCFCPSKLIGDEQVGITGLAFSDQSELLVSYNEDNIYLFTRDMGLGPDPFQVSRSFVDSNTAGMGSDPVSTASSSSKGAGNIAEPQVYEGHINRDTVKGVNFFGPNCEYVVSGSDCGHIFIWRKKGGQLLRAMEADKDVVNCIESHPHATMLASSGIESDIKLWTPKSAERATLPVKVEPVKKHDGIDRFLCHNVFIFDDDDDDDDGGYDDDDDDDDGDDDGGSDDDDGDDNDYDDNDNDDDDDGNDDDGGDDNDIDAASDDDHDNLNHL